MADLVVEPDRISGLELATNAVAVAWNHHLSCRRAEAAPPVLLTLA